MAARIAEADEEGSLDGLLAAAAAGRAHLRHRLSFPVRSLAELSGRLREFADDESKNGDKRAAPRVMFLFPADATFSGIDTASAPPAFRDSLESLSERAGKPGLFTDPARIRSAEEEGAFVFSCQYALAEMWHGFGVRPFERRGTGVGALSAACLSGDLSVEEALEAAMAGGQEGPPSRDAAGYEIIVEFSASETSLRKENPEARWIAFPRDEQALAEALSLLYTRGVDINWSEVYRGVPKSRKPLPNYPFERKRCWLEPDAIASFDWSDE